MAGGEQGVARAAELLTGEIIRTMRLLGVRNVDGLTADRVRLREPGS